MATEADLIQKFKDLNIPVGADFEELIHEAFIGANLVDQVNSKADDSKVVHTADMRKPAGDVAGIDEVSTLQTQVDNSAVGTNLYTDTKNFDNLPSWVGFGSWKKTTDAYNGFGVMQTTDSWSGLSQYIQVKKGDILTYSAYAKNTSGTGTSAIYWQLDWDSEGSHSTATANPYNKQITITDSWQRVSGTTVATSDGYLRPRLERTDNNTNTMQIAGIKIEKGSVATDWCPNPSEVLTKSDDSKVAHLSGANNFDTVPTVNNNPLLLASSLPSDLARTSQQTNFTAGLQSNGTAVATQTDVTTAISAATANMVDSSKPTNFTAGLKSGGVDVATAADIKSVKDSAWKLLVNSDATTAFYRLVNGTLYISGYARVGGNGGNIHANLKIVSQLPTELQNKVWTIKNKMTVGLNNGGYDMTADLYFGEDSSLSAISSVPTGRTNDGIVIFNNSYTQS